MSKLSQRSCIYVAGHNGMVGSAVARNLRAAGYENLVTRSRAELDLTDQTAVNRFYAATQIDAVIVCAARVGGIHANDTYPAEFIYENLMIECNLIHGAYVAGIQTLVFLGSSCIYPRLADQPMAESALLTGPLEPTNEPYALAKIAGIKLCESYNRQHGTDYRSLMPTNLYGPGDQFDNINSHVIPALLSRFHRARCDGHPEVQVWGSGNARREFLHVDDLAAATRFTLCSSGNEYWSEASPRQSHLNVGTGTDVSIAELSRSIAQTVGFDGNIVFDTSRPDGAPIKLLDVSAMHRLGWRASTELRDGLADTYAWYLASIGQAP